MILIRYPFILSISGIFLMLLANMILLAGRKPGESIRRVVSAGHMSRKERRQHFYKTNVIWFESLALAGASLFLISILIVLYNTVTRI
jgi:hypothetical protein